MRCHRLAWSVTRVAHQNLHGLVCERLKQTVLKTVIPAMVSGVQIPPNPPLVYAPVVK